MNRLERIQRSLTKKTVPKFEIGDTVRVHVKVVEGEKERIQVYEGTVIARKGTLNSETFTVRKLSYNVGVERTFPIHSPNVAKVDVVRQGRVRRAKLYRSSGPPACPGEPDIAHRMLGRPAIRTGHSTDGH